MKRSFKNPLVWACAVAAIALLLPMCHSANKIEDMQRRAEAGEAEAQYELGMCYYKGDGVEQNHEEAVKWFCESAEQGYAPAQFNIGVRYAIGYGVEQNHAEALKWYNLSAEQGYAPAQFYLGSCYENGDGVERNHEEAVKWYRKAAVQEHQEAREALKKLGEKW